MLKHLPFSSGEEFETWACQRYHLRVFGLPFALATLYVVMALLITKLTGLRLHYFSFPVICLTLGNALTHFLKSITMVGRGGHNPRLAAQMAYLTLMFACAFFVAVAIHREGLAPMVAHPQPVSGGPHD